MFNIPLPPNPLSQHSTPLDPLLFNSVIKSMLTYCACRAVDAVGPAARPGPQQVGRGWWEGLMVRRSHPAARPPLLGTCETRKDR